MPIQRQWFENNRKSSENKTDCPNMSRRKNLKKTKNLEKICCKNFPNHVQWIAFIGLLLLRAFSSELFAAGAPPGPYCLLHYLREKFNTQAETPNGLCPRKVQERSLDGKHEDIPNGHCPETLNGLCPRKVQEKSSDDRHEGEPNGHCPESENSIEEAAEEYRKRVATYEARKTIRKHSGPQWQCCECSLTFPAEGFGATAQNTNDITTHCVAPGFWRCCEACHRDRQKTMPADQANTFTQCQLCSQLRPSRHFEGSSDKCNACTLRASFEIFICCVCNKAKHSKDMREGDVGSGDFVCSGCAPNLWLFECTACNEVKPATDFRDFRDGLTKLTKQTIRRCKTCEICKSCKNHFEDFREFETNAQHCRTCYKTIFASKKCAICRKAKSRSEFPYQQLRHEREPTQNLFLRCTSCHVCETCKEYKDIRAFNGVSSECQTCSNNSQVTLRCNICNNLMPKASFPGNQFLQKGCQDRNEFLRCVHCHTCKDCKEQKNIRAFRENSTVCVHCRNSATTLQCNVCNNWLARSEFPDSRHTSRQDRNTSLRCVHCHTCRVCKEKKDIRAFHKDSSRCIQCHNSRTPCDGCKRIKLSTEYDPGVLKNAQHGRKIVCVECTMKGLSPKDVDMYKCDECGDRGHKKFNHEQLRQHKNSKGQKKIVCTDCTDRQKQIERVLRLPKAWKCKCPGKGHDRHHDQKM